MSRVFGERPFSFCELFLFMCFSSSFPPSFFFAPFSPLQASRLREIPDFLFSFYLSLSIKSLPKPPTRATCPGLSPPLRTLFALEFTILFQDQLLRPSFLFPLEPLCVRAGESPPAAPLFLVSDALSTSGHYAPGGCWQALTGSFTCAISDRIVLSHVFPFLTW